MDGQVDGWMGGLIRWMDGLDRRMHGWKGGWMDG